MGLRELGVFGFTEGRVDRLPEHQLWTAVVLRIFVDLSSAEEYIRREAASDVLDTPDDIKEIIFDWCGFDARTARQVWNLLKESAQSSKRGKVRLSRFALAIPKSSEESLRAIEPKVVAVRRHYAASDWPRSIRRSMATVGLSYSDYTSYSEFRRRKLGRPLPSCYAKDGATFDLIFPPQAEGEQGRGERANENSATYEKGEA